MSDAGQKKAILSPNIKRKNSKKKRVSFLIYAADTFDEIEKLRRIREDQLETFIQAKAQTNKKLSNFNNEKDGSNVRYNDIFTHENKISNKDDNNFNNTAINTINNSPKGQDITSNDSQIQKKIEYKIHSPKSSKTPINFSGAKIPEDSNENLCDESGDFEQTFQNKELEKVEKLQKEKEEQRIKEELERQAELLRLKEQLQNQKKENEIREKALEEKIKTELEEKYKFEAEIKAREMLMKGNLLSLIGVLKRSLNSKRVRSFYIKEFIGFLRENANSQFDYWLNYEKNDAKYNNYIRSKVKFFLAKVNFTKFRNRVLDVKERKLLQKSNEEKVIKYSLYRRYKQKVFIFEALSKYAKKQRAWIRATQNELMKNLIWSCFDSMKLYVNYKKIKSYLKESKRKKIFEALRNNKQLSIELAKKGKKISLIFEYKHFFKNVRKSMLIKKGVDVNNKIVEEYRRQNLMKKIFSTLKRYFVHKKDKEARTKMSFINKYENKDYITVKISSKESVKYLGNTAYKRTSNKIKIC